MNNTMELNLEEMSLVNAGWNWKGFGLGFVTGGAYSALAAGSFGLVVGGPVGAGIGAVVGGLAGGVAMGVYGGLCTHE